MKLFLAAYFVLQFSELVFSKETFPDIKRALESINHCVARSQVEEDSPTKLHQDMAGAKKRKADTEEDMLLQLQALTGSSRRTIRSCLNKGDPSCPEYTCGDSDTYSSIEGTCNNLGHPYWGSSNIAYLRDLHPVYADGVKSLRKALDGSDLPNPRVISNALLSETEEQLDDVYTKWLSTFGQMLAHDILHTPTARDENGRFINCCDQSTNDCCASQCLPINVTGDPYFSLVNQTCMNFVRSVAVPCNLCKLATYGCKRDQLNELSAYIDGSATYGESAEQLAGLRNGTTAYLNTRPFQIDGIPLSYLPGRPRGCRDGTDDRPCFDAGDSRGNMVPSLQAVLTLFMREHNRVVDKLRTVTSWDEEKLFQESRKIVIAELQHFTLSHYMEIVLGSDLAAQYGLDEVDGYHSVYDSYVNAGIANHFATAAFRFGHSHGTSTQGQHEKINNTLLVSFPQAELYFRVAESYNNEGIDGILRFLQSNKMGGVDSALPDAVRNQLFLNLITRTSLDLGTLNTQRGRDHGMPSYNAWKEWCGQEPFPANHTQNMTDKIRAVYAYDQDIDLFVGGLSEKVVPGAVVGPLFGCMIGRQMQRSKTGDRYYFQNPPDSTTTISRFTEEQVRSIQGFTLARMVCENTDTMVVQKNVFMQVSSYNPEIHCGTANADSEIPDIDFTLWADANR